MREIKFRAKTLSGELVYGVTNLNAVSIIKETLEQFTGLYDKNGKEIYEGDIVKLDLNNEGFKEAIVVYKYGCFVFDTPKEVYTVWESDVLEKNIEIIGNIHWATKEATL